MTKEADSDMEAPLSTDTWVKILPGVLQHTQPNTLQAHMVHTHSAPSCLLKHAAGVTYAENVFNCWCFYEMQIPLDVMWNVTNTDG